MWAVYMSGLYETSAMGFQRILAAMDASPLSASILRRAMDVAVIPQSRLLLFRCVTVEALTGPPPFAGEFGLSPQIMRQAYQTQHMVQEQRTHEARSQLEGYQAIATQAGLQTEVSYQTVEPGMGICTMARQWNADLIVMGRRGHRGLSEVLLGSVSNYVLHHAPCAVLVVHPEDDCC